MFAERAICKTGIFYVLYFYIGISVVTKIDDFIQELVENFFTVAIGIIYTFSVYCIAMS